MSRAKWRRRRRRRSRPPPRGPDGGADGGPPRGGGGGGRSSTSPPTIAFEGGTSSCVLATTANDATRTTPPPRLALPPPPPTTTKTKTEDERGRCRPPRSRRWGCPPSRNRRRTAPSLNKILTTIQFPIVQRLGISEFRDIKDSLVSPNYLCDQIITSFWRTPPRSPHLAPRPNRTLAPPPSFAPHHHFCDDGI